MVYRPNVFEGRAMSFRNVKETNKIWRITEWIRILITVAGWCALAFICMSGLFTKISIGQKVFMVIGYLYCIYGWTYILNKVTISIRKKLRK